MSKRLLIGSALLVSILFVAALISDDLRRNVSSDIPLVPPQRNPHPTERVKLYVTAPPNLKLNLMADYSVGTWFKVSTGGYSSYGGTFCGPGSGAQPDFRQATNISLPIPLKWDGNAYEGEIYIDHYLPGPSCHWSFNGLYTSSPTEQRIAAGTEVPKNVNLDASGNHGIYDQFVNQSNDFWCGPDPSTLIPRLHGKMVCTSLDGFTSPGVVANELLASVSAERRGRVDSLEVYPNSKTLTLRFHDVAAENLAAIASPSARTKLTGKCPADGVRLYVTEQGTILVDGTEVPMQDLNQHLRELRPSPKLACYAQANGEAPASRSGDLVAFVVRGINLPLELFADASFTRPATLKH